MRRGPWNIVDRDGVVVAFRMRTREEAERELRDDPCGTFWFEERGPYRVVREQKAK